MDQFSGVDDKDLLTGGVADVWTGNLASAGQWARMVEFHRRREAAYDAHEREAQRLLLTARQETVVEIGELWGTGEAWLRKQLNVAQFLHDRLPTVWALCRSGQLDAYRATLIAALARAELEVGGDLRRFAETMTAYLHKHLRGVPGLLDEHGREVPPLVCCTIRQLRNKLGYELRKLRPAGTEARHHRARADRAVRSRDLDDGMSQLGIIGTVDQVRLAEHRLSLAARERRAAGDLRTFDKLRSDLALNLLTGTGEDVPLPAYARPVINLTVPVQTVMGLSDDPGVLSGGTVIPAAWSSCRPRATGPPLRSGGGWSRTGAPASAPGATARPPSPRPTTGSRGRKGQPAPPTSGRVAEPTTRPSTPRASPSSRLPTAASSCAPGPG